MRIAEEKEEIIELYNDNYEICMTLYANTPVAEYLRSKKLIDDWANKWYKYFENKLEETAGSSFLYLKV